MHEINTPSRFTVDEHATAFDDIYLNARDHPAHIAVHKAMLEDVLRSHWLVSQAAVVGDSRPYVAALLTLDPEALSLWKQDHSMSIDLDNASLVDDPVLIDELQGAVNEANATVSKAEGIKRWLVLPRHFSETAGGLTPTTKLRRHVIAAEFS
jgi:long-chain acyl-CoA synthetase